MVPTDPATMTEPAKPLPFPEIPTTKKLQLKKWEEPWLLNDSGYPREPKTPSEWFSKRFSDQAKIYGCPFLELNEQSSEGFTKINALSANIDFLASILGGEKRFGHHVIYFEPDMQFYFRDADQIYKPTSEEKLGSLLRALLIRCAEELPENVSKFSLFQEFRSDKTIRAVVRRAKCILAADHTFFGPESKHERQKGPEMHERVARVFIEQALEKQPGEMLTLTNAYLYFCEYLKQQGMEPVKRNIFKRIFSPLIREEFNLCLRNDLVNGTTKKQSRGWKGLRAVDFEAVGDKGLEA